jgi:hypothetical protein
MINYNFYYEFELISTSASPNIAESLSHIKSPINILVILFVFGILYIPVHHEKSIGFPDLGDKYNNYGVLSKKNFKNILL